MLRKEKAPVTTLSFLAVFHHDAYLRVQRLENCYRWISQKVLMRGNPERLSVLLWLSGCPAICLFPIRVFSIATPAVNATCEKVNPSETVA